MDPNERQSERQHHQPPPPPHLPPATGTVASTGSLAHPQSDNNNNNATSRNASPSPSTSRRSAQPSTPFAEGNTSTEYFPTLEVSPSLLQLPSHTGTTRTRPHSNSNVSSLDEAARGLRRQPSIRLRRRSSSTRSNRPGSVRNEGAAQGARSQDNISGGTRPSNNGDEGSSVRASASRQSSSGRPRSISQPERAHVPQDTLLARHSRRAPQIAMPRLTEEGARPTMEELDASNRSPSPTHSLPERQLSLSRNRTEPGPGPPDGPQRLQRMRNMSRFFWPRRQTQQSQQGEAQEAQQQPGELQARAEDEYNERLVDYLDTIGMLPPSS